MHGFCPILLPLRPHQPYIYVRIARHLPFRRLHLGHFSTLRCGWLHLCPVAKIFLQRTWCAPHIPLLTPMPGRQLPPVPAFWPVFLPGQWRVLVMVSVILLLHFISPPISGLVACLTGKTYKSYIIFSVQFLIHWAKGYLSFSVFYSQSPFLDISAFTEK